MSANAVKNANHDSPESTSQTRCHASHESRRAPILKLSEDVLLIIFIMLRDSEWRTRTMVIRITHVCQEWRYIAIGAPLLWNQNLFSYRPDWTLIALQRALTAPIGVYIDFRDSNGVTGVSKVLLGHIWHTSRLDLGGTCEELDEAQKLIAENSAVQLKQLDIRCINYGAVEPPRSFVLSSTTFRHTSQLRSLMLYRVDIDFNSPLLRNLTTLHLQHISATAVPTWPKLLEALHAMPLLEDLKLEHVFPQSDIFVTPLLPVNLNSLRKFFVDGNTASQICIILGLVFFPPLSCLVLQWDVDDIGPQDQSIIFQSIAESVYAQHLGHEVGSLYVEYIPEAGRIRLWAITHHGGPGLYVYLPENSVDIGDVRFIENFLDILCLSKITMFDLKIDYEYDHLDLIRLTSKMPDLEFITVGNNTAFNFIELLDVEPLSSPSEPPLEVRLPLLDCITWDGGDFSGREAWVEEVAAAVLSRRQERGHGVNTLEFNEVKNLSSGMIGLLEKGGTEVIVRA